MRRTMLPLTLIVFAACRAVPIELTEEEKAAIVDEIAGRYAAAAEAIRARDVDGWLTFYENSEDLTFTSCVENGEVAMYRSWAVRRDTTYAHYGALASMDRFEWGPLRTRVLARDVALVSTTYWAEATDTTGVSFAGDATWVALWVKSEGEWKMASVAETWAWPEEPGEGN